MLLAWFFCAFLIAIWSSARGTGFWYGFAFSLILSPLIGAIIVGCTTVPAATEEKKQLADGFHRKCPSCAEIIKSEALICRFCGRAVDPEKPPDTHLS